MTKPWPMTEVPDAFSDTETSLRERMLANGHPAAVASAISRAFVFYCLGWWTLEGAAMAIHLNGADKEEARSLAMAFKEARQAA